jgi:hypothetical protein
MKGEQYSHRMERDDDDDSLTRNLRRSRALACKDRTCGADDCPTCRPGTWREAVIQDLEEEGETP